MKTVFTTALPASPRASPNRDYSWRIRLEMAPLWRDAVHRRGGDVTVVHLPQRGIHGNTHFPFSDLMSDFLKQKGLDTL